MLFLHSSRRHAYKASYTVFLLTFPPPILGIFLFARKPFQIANKQSFLAPLTASGEHFLTPQPPSHIQRGISRSTCILASPICGNFRLPVCPLALWNGNQPNFSRPTLHLHRSFSTGLAAATHSKAHLAVHLHPHTVTTDEHFLLPVIPLELQPRSFFFPARRLHRKFSHRPSRRPTFKDAFRGLLASSPHPAHTELFSFAGKPPGTATTQFFLSPLGTCIGSSPTGPAAATHSETHFAVHLHPRLAHKRAFSFAH